MTDHNPLRRLPAITALLESEAGAALLAQHPRGAVLQALRDSVEALRGELLSDQAPPEPLTPLVMAEAAKMLAAAHGGLRPVINATGIIVHTNLGRSVLAESAARAVHEICLSYNNLEVDLESGRRSSRHDHIEARLTHVIGAEAGGVFNNNAAAVLLALAVVASGREVIVSRGQLVEIGGSFRIPEVMEQSGCILREVGATNRTHLHDYERGINENTGAILRVHQSNFRIIGFTAEPSIEELAVLAHARGLPLIDDLGSGALLDPAPLGIGDEPTVGRSLAAPADVTTFSGDKLLGGPQCGIAVGRRDLIEQMKHHPLARAVRVGKMTIAALAATLDLLADPERAVQEIPTLRAATEPVEAVTQRAEALAEAIAVAAPRDVDVRVELDSSARIGGGALPEEELQSAAVCIRLAEDAPPNEIARRLRLGDPAVYARVHEGALVLDARTVFPSQVTAAAAAVITALNPPEEAECAGGSTE